MRILFVIFFLISCSGCEALGDIVREKKYNFSFHETPTTEHKIGYNDDYDYIGYSISGKFGSKKQRKHIPR